MVRFVVLGAAFACALAAPIDGAWQVVTMQGGAPPPVASQQPAPKGTGLIVGQVVDADSGRPVPGAMVSLTSNLPATPEEMIAGAILTRRVIASGEGRFMFHSIPPGRISLSAMASSHIPASPGQRRPMGPSQPLTLADDERVAAVMIKMWKYAAIEGRVVDENNEPAVRVQVRVWRREWGGGRLRMTPGSTTSTDDRGAFRIAQLIPGDYYVSVPSIQETMPVSVAQRYQELLDGGRGTGPADLSRQLSSSGAPSPSVGGQRVGDHVLQAGRAVGGLARPITEGERLFVYPVAFEPNLGQEPIRLTSGEQRRGVEIALSLIPGVAVSGVVTGPDGPLAHMGVQLTPSRLYDAAVSAGVEVARTATDANGAFTFLGVPGDQYRLSVLFVPRPTSLGATSVITSGGGAMTITTMDSGGASTVPAEPTLYAGMDLAVGREDVVGLNVPVHIGARLSGTVVFNGVATPPTPEQVARMTINVRPAAGGFIGILSPGRVDADMKIKTIGYPAGRYFVTAFSPAPGWWLSSVLAGSHDVGRSGIELGREDVTNLVLTFTDRRTEVTGTVRARAATGDPDAVVLAVPSDLRGWIAEGMNPRLMATARTTAAGVYAIGGLPAGDYRIIAMSEDVAPEARDPAFLERLVQLGTTISLREGDKRTLDLRTETPPRRAPAPSLHLASDPVGDDTVPPAPSDTVQRNGPFVPDHQTAVQQRTPPRDITTISPAGTGVIAGTVVTDADKKPIRKVQVQLNGSALRPARVTTTDDAGRFLFRDVPAGRFTIQATRPPYVDTAYGSPRPGRAGTTLALTEGQRITDLTIPMIRGAVIEGTVLNEFGLPEERAQVTLLQQRPGVEGPQLAITGGSLFMSTDDRGRYRLFGLAPGDYIVGVSNRSMSGANLTRITDADMQWAKGALGPKTSHPPPPSSQALANATVYHPDVTDLANARVIKLGAAEERIGVDISLISVPAAKVEGRIATADGQRPSQLQVSMLAEGMSVPLVSPRLFVRPTADGSFQVEGVVPGRYVITARAASRLTGAPANAPPGGRAAAPNLDLWAMQTVEVHGQDVTGISMTLAPGLNVRGRVVFDATTATPPERFGGVSVRLSPASTTGVTLGVSPATVTEDGTFALSGVTPNAYRVGASAPGRTANAPTWTVRSVVIAGRDVSDVPLIVTPDADVTELVVTMTDRVTEITGLLLDGSGRPAPELTMLVFPVDREQWGRDSRRRPPPTRPGTDGRYRLIAVPPGEYYMVALSDIAPEELYDSSLLESLIPSALKISLAEGEKKVQDFKLSGR